MSDSATLWTAACQTPLPWGVGVCIKDSLGCIPETDTTPSINCAPVIFLLNLAFYNLLPRFPGGSDGKVCACKVGDLGWGDTLEKEMATHSSILAWKNPMDGGAWCHKELDKTERPHYFITAHMINANVLEVACQVSTRAPITPVW